MKESVLYGVKAGNEDWQESILSTNPARFDEVKVMATRDGWGRFRVAVIDLDVPTDFAGTVKHQA